MREARLEMVTKLLEAGSELNYLVDTIPPTGNIIENISYVQDNSDSHKLDIIYPTAVQKKYPFIINIHGGGFACNTKDRLYRNYAMRLAGNRFAVVNINFRLSKEAIFPAQIKDALSVITFLEKNCDMYKLDINNMFFVGDSSGAYMAAMTECVLTNPQLAEYYSFSTKAVCCGLALNCGLFDFTTFMGADVHFPLKKEILTLLFGTKDYAKAEAFNYTSIPKSITNNFAPAYIMDTQIQSFETEALRLASALQEKDVPYKLHIFDKKELLVHAFNVASRFPQSDIVLAETFEFFNQYCK